MRHGARAGSLDELHSQARRVAQHDGADSGFGYLQALLDVRESEGVGVPGFLRGEVRDREVDVVEASNGHDDSLVNAIYLVSDVNLWACLLPLLVVRSATITATCATPSWRLPWNWSASE